MTSDFTLIIAPDGAVVHNAFEIGQPECPVDMDDLDDRALMWAVAHGYADQTWEVFNYDVLLHIQRGHADRRDFPSLQLTL